MATSAKKAKAKKGDGWATSDEVIAYLVGRLTEDDKKRPKSSAAGDGRNAGEYNPISSSNG